MTWAIDIYYKRPMDRSREDFLVERVAQLGGRMSFREESTVPDAADNVCLTFEFDDQTTADLAVHSLTQDREHVEGPYDYG